MLASGVVDFALTYNAAAEAQSVNSGIASDRVYAFRVCGTILDVFPVKLQYIGSLYSRRTYS